MANESARTRLRSRSSFLERTLNHLLEAVEHSFTSERTARNKGLLQAIDPRAKVVCALALIIGTAASGNVLAISVVFVLAVFLAAVSGVSLSMLAGRVWMSVLVFAAVIGGPAVFLTRGDVVAHVPILGWPVIAQGLRSAALLTARMETTVTVSVVLISTTSWTHVLKSLRVLRVPVLFIVILSMTYRFIFLLLHTAVDMVQARRSRMVGRLRPKDRRRMTAALTGVLLGKTHHVSEEVYAAMLSRGYRGEVYLLDDFALKRADWLAMSAAVVVAIGVSGVFRWTS